MRPLFPFARQQQRYSVGGYGVGADFVGQGPGYGYPALPQPIALQNLRAAMPLGRPGGSALPGAYQLSGRLPYGAPLPHFAPSHPRIAKRIILGFGTTSVSASATANLISRPQKWFQPERLYIPAAQGTNFAVNDIKVGNVSMFLNVNAGSSVIFVENATDSAVSFDTADPAVDISVVVVNLDGAASHSITPTMLGVAAM